MTQSVPPNEGEPQEGQESHGLFWHHRPSCQPAWVNQLLHQQQQILNGVITIMALVQVEQTDLDTLATNLQTAIAAVGTEVKNLEAQVAAGNLPAGSLDGLNSALTALQALEPPAPAPTA
ncbi:hypothetical protein [Mycolicibacterium brisbanense]|uniref:Uncharacterized protein n=1 Tax=Mycolicibacterium brisbanense TaxID=146020 RepID=A0A100W711_9MYCO|nr:hypothetical protein [Mycolicibacterium brisbanense]MCV7158051.1 hypothetical protein [Mycolicibacterium brisbanense]GAS92701.1 uncharacterized protein RMCB_6797 [Mycolicibacterium brisbanense]